MFDNIGGKIKKVAQIVCWIGIVASVISGIALMATDEDLVGAGFLVLIGGPLVSWVGSFMVYGFGQLVENSDILVSEKTGGKVESAKSTNSTNDKIENLNKWKEQGLITEEEYNQKMETLK